MTTGRFLVRPAAGGTHLPGVWEGRRFEVWEGCRFLGTMVRQHLGDRWGWTLRDPRDEPPAYPYRSGARTKREAIERLAAWARRTGCETSPDASGPRRARQEHGA